MRTEFLMLPHPLTNFEIQKYQNECRCNGLYSRNNLPNTQFYSKIKNGTYVINLDEEYADIGTHWIALYSNGNTKTYFDNFGVEHIPKEIYRQQKHYNKHLQNTSI